MGTYQASSHLIDTGDGLILIDTGYADTLHLVIHSIWELGFRPQDIRYIIHSHYHGDHTVGTVSLFFETVDHGIHYRVGMFGGAGANTLVSTHPGYYPQCRRDYLQSIERLLKEHVDVFIGNHCWNNDTTGKGKRQKAGEPNPFIDETEWIRFLNFCKQRCESLP